MTEIKPINIDILKNLELDLASNKYITSDNSSLNKESYNIKENNQINIIKNNKDIIDDLTSIIKNKIKIKILSNNNNNTKRNKTERNYNSPFKNFTETKNKEKFQENLNNNINKRYIYINNKRSE